MADPRDFSKTAASNTTVGGVNIAEGANTAQMNDSQRAILATLAPPADFGATAGAVTVDDIAESTVDAGVTVDGLLIKDGDIPTVPATIAALIPTGVILPTATAAASSGFLLCDGSAVSRTTYSALFTAIGTTYGVGDGSTTFNLPDLRGRTPIGVGTGAGLTARALAATGGEEEVVLLQENLPDVNLSLSLPRKFGSNSGGAFGWGNDSGLASNTPASIPLGGSDTPHENMPPFIALNFMIKT